MGGRGKTLGAIDLHVASRVREQRILLGISQPQMASALGLTFQQVYKYEQGKNRISAGRLYEFGKILGVPITFFFEGVVDAPTSAAALPSAGDADPLETREAGELLRAYRHIRPTATTECTTTCKSFRTRAERFYRKVICTPAPQTVAPGAYLEAAPRHPSNEP